MRSTDEELSVLARQGDPRAREELVTRHSGFAHWCAQRHAVNHPSAEFEELVQASMWGLWHATSKWDPSKARITTYARPWCIVYMQREVTNDRKKHAHCHPTQMVELGSYEDDRLEVLGTSHELLLALKTLPEREQRVVILKLGLDGKHRTTRQVADEVGLSLQGMHNAYKRGIARLQPYFEIG
jgi:RNA polymerase sigma factor (sigma-70 family)